MPESRTLRLELTFDGTDFEGWQRQASARTVQGEVEQALSRVLRVPHNVVGCGRTDSGVHAQHYVASTRTAHAMPADELARALDAVLPPDIGVLNVRDAQPSFHALRDAAWKWYRYTLLVSRRKRPLARRRVWRVSKIAPLPSLAAAARPLVGCQDFRSFANHGSTPGTTVRTLYALRWSRVSADPASHGTLLRLDAVGDGFLYKMVRTIVGTLCQEAHASDPEAAVREIRDRRDRRAGGTVAPACGLCLMAVALWNEPPPAGVPEILLRHVDLAPRSPIGGNS